VAHNTTCFFASEKDFSYHAHLHSLERIVYQYEMCVLYADQSKLFENNKKKIKLTRAIKLLTKALEYDKDGG